MKLGPYEIDESETVQVPRTHGGYATGHVALDYGDGKCLVVFYDYLHEKWLEKVVEKVRLQPITKSEPVRMDTSDTHPNEDETILGESPLEEDS
jgi:hypothetical protein